MTQEVVDKVTGGWFDWRTVDFELGKVFVENTDIAPLGCWLWTGVISDQGYGLIRRDGRYRRAHRVNYERCVGPIPSGLVLDHLCRVTRCVRPNHLEPVTSAENTRRGDFSHLRETRPNHFHGVAVINAAKTHCPQGHPYDEANTYIERYNGARRCRKCWNAIKQRQRERRRSRQ